MCVQCDRVVLIVGWVAVLATLDLEVVALRHGVVHMWAWPGASLRVKVPAHYGAIIKTLDFRSHTP